MVKKGRKKGEFTFIYKVQPLPKLVYLAGSFNHWSPVNLPMEKNKDGTFSKNLLLGPGRYEYKFITDGIWMNDPDASENVPNNFGTLNSVVRVK